MTVSIGPENGQRFARGPRIAPPLLFTALGSLAGFLAGCTGLFHSNARPEQVYYLRATPAPQGAAAPRPVAASLRFSRPIANPGLESAHIVLVQSDRRMSYFLASRWPAPTSSMVETLAVEKLRASGLWQSVADSTSAFPSDYVLQVTVRRFEADYTSGGNAPDVHVVLDCIVGKREGREVIASLVAEGSATAAANRLSAVVAAFETAANTAVDSLSAQTLEAVRISMTHQGAQQRKE
ncbi:MAG: ABC-type transport auxiliary lipoprotein family protein [Steroidobacteraceae bacterium]